MGRLKLGVKQLKAFFLSLSSSKRCWNSKPSNAALLSGGSVCPLAHSLSRGLDSDGTEAHTREQATAMVCQHWKDVWREVPVDQDRAVEALVDGFGPVGAMQWKEDLLFSVRHCKGLRD